MKDDILKVLDMLDKGTISAKEAGELIEKIKGTDEEQKKTDNSCYTCEELGEEFEKMGEELEEEFEYYKEETKKAFDYDKTVESAEKFIKDSGDKINDVFEEIKPELLSFTKKVVDKVADLSRIASEKLDGNATSNKEPVNEADEIIKNYEEEN